MIIAEQVMNKVGFNTSIPNSIIFVGRIQLVASYVDIMQHK